MSKETSFRELHFLGLLIALRWRSSRTGTRKISSCGPCRPHSSRCPKRSTGEVELVGLAGWVFWIFSVFWVKKSLGFVDPFFCSCVMNLWKTGHEGMPLKRLGSKKGHRKYKKTPRFPGSLRTGTKGPRKRHQKQGKNTNKWFLKGLNTSCFF